MIEFYLMNMGLRSHQFMKEGTEEFLEGRPLAGLYDRFLVDHCKRIDDLALRVQVWIIHRKVLHDTVVQIRHDRACGVRVKLVREPARSTGQIWIKASLLFGFLAAHKVPTYGLGVFKDAGLDGFCVRSGLASFDERVIVYRNFRCGSGCRSRLHCYEPQG